MGGLLGDRADFVDGERCRKEDRETGERLPLCLARARDENEARAAVCLLPIVGHARARTPAVRPLSSSPFASFALSLSLAIRPEERLFIFF
jgi:hypothetical protein